MPTAKDEVRRIVDALPDDATWEDLRQAIYLRERIEGRMERWLSE